MPEEPVTTGLGTVTEKAGMFPFTHWTVVLAARDGQDAQAEAALDALCHAYWYPLYAYLRRDGCSAPDAQDLTQGFFEHLFEHETLSRVAREKGRFRSFLLASLKYYLADQRAREQRQKRGGGQHPFPLDALTAEERYRLEPRDDRTPEQLFERRWVLALETFPLGAFRKLHDTAFRVCCIAEQMRART